MEKILEKLKFGVGLKNSPLLEAATKWGGRKTCFSMFFIICLFLIVPYFSANAGVGDDIVNAVKNSIGSLVYGIIYVVMYFLLNVVAMIVHFGAWLVDVMLNPNLYQAVLSDSNPAIETGWSTVRDFCNMFYVFFLLLIAFSTILRMQSYSVKSLLPKVILSLFLINFSAEITKIVIDLGQIFLFGIAGNWMGSFSGSEGSGAALTSIVGFFQSRFSGDPSPSFSDVVGITFAVAYTFVLGFLYVILAGFLLVRLIMFVILIIISPFAFFSLILPSMRRYTSEWQSMLISNAISGPVFIFFIYISGVMAKGLLSDASLQNSTLLGDTSEFEFMVPILNVIIPHLIAMGVLLFAIPAAQRAGAMGSNYFVGGRMGIGKIQNSMYGAAKMPAVAVGAAGAAAGWAAAGANKNLARLDSLGIKSAGKLKTTFDNSANKAKALPIAGEIFIKRAAEQAKKNEEKVSKEKAFMENLSLKDAKTWVDQSLDPAKRAVRQQAFADILAKDSGKNITDHSLKGLGITDPQKYLKDILKDSNTFNLPAKNLKKYRPDTIGDVKAREEEVVKMVKDGAQGAMSLSAIKDDTVRSTLRREMGDKEFFKWLDGKSANDRFEVSESMIDDKLRVGGVVDTDIAGIVAHLQKGGKAIERDAHNNKHMVAGVPVTINANVARTFSANPDPAVPVAPVTPGFETFVRNLSGVGLGDYTADDISEMLPYLTRTHLANSNKMAQNKKDVIIGHYWTGHTHGTSPDPDIFDYIDKAREWKG